MEFFINLAWNTERWNGENLDEYLKLWAKREFGQDAAADLSSIVATYSKYNGRRKPEMLAPDTYSLTDYREALRVVADYKGLVTAYDDVTREMRLPKNSGDALYQLVGFPI